MTRQEFLRQLEEAMEVESGFLSGNAVLTQLNQWDSLAILNFMVCVEQQFDFVLDGDVVGKARTVDDLISMLGDRVQG